MPVPDFNRIFLNVNVESRQLIDDDGNALAGNREPQFFREELSIICLTLVDNTGAAVALPATATFEAGLALDFDDTTVVEALSENDQVNVAGDWADADVALGKLSVRINTNTTQFANALGTAPRDADGWLYLTMFSGAYPCTLLQHNAVYRNVHRPSGTAPAGITSPTYRTAAAEDILLADKLDKVGTVDLEITDTAKGLIFTDIADGLRKRMRISHGMPYITPV